MRKLFSLMLVVLGATALLSCSKDDDDDVLRDGEGVITFVTEAKSLTLDDDSALCLETFNEEESITIDWGDGNEEEYVYVRVENKPGDFVYAIISEHTYTDGKSSHTVTARGKIIYFGVYNCEVTSIDVTKCPALEDLNCKDNQLTSLDVSKNTALEGLRCDGNQLTSLDISKNKALDYLDCEDNRFNASAMNKIYNDLPVVEYGELVCDKLGKYSIAERKGWNVIHH